MSKTLDFVRILFDRARHCHDAGLHDEAKKLFARLADFRQLPADVAEQTQIRLAELCREEDDAFQERQHLSCALAQQPNNADYHFRMAEAYERDEDGLDEKAIPHLRAAVRIEPDNPRYLAEFGSLATRLGQTPQGLRLLKKAHQLDEDDLDVLERYADALIDAGQADEARDVLKVAMFRHSSDSRYRDLYREFQFRAVAEDQAKKASIPFDAPTLLPFVRATPKRRRFAIDGQVFRVDGAEPLNGPSRRTTSRKKQTP